MEGALKSEWGVVSLVETVMVLLEEVKVSLGIFTELKVVVCLVKVFCTLIN